MALSAARLWSATSDLSLCRAQMLLISRVTAHNEGRNLEAVAS